MTKKSQRINFEMSTIDEELANELVKVNKSIYLKRLIHFSFKSSVKFSIPKEIVQVLELKPKDECYFYRTNARMYITFFNPPDGISPKQYRVRHLSNAGDYNTLSVLIPKLITDEIPKSKLEYIRLIQPQGLGKTEWQIEFLSSD